MKFSIYIPIALAVTAVAFWIVPLKPDAAFYPIPKSGVPVVSRGIQGLDLSGQLLLECSTCNQPATQSTSRLEAGTKLGRGAGIRLACDKHASIPMLERATDRIVLSSGVLVLFAVIGLVIHRRQMGRKALPAS